MQGNVFIRVCHSVHGEGGLPVSRVVCLWTWEVYTPWTHTPSGTPTWTKNPKNTLLDTHTPDTPSGHTHPWSHTPPNTHTSGQTSPLTHIPGHIHPIGLAIEAGSTHPTGMRSCYVYEVAKYFFIASPFSRAVVNNFAL